MMHLSAADSDLVELNMEYDQSQCHMEGRGRGKDGALWLVVGVEDLTHNYIVCPVTCEG
jgi:hypothetical protein